MKMKFAAATALASSLLILPLMQGSAQSASIPSLPSHLSDLTLIGHGNGGGGGGGANFSGGGGGGGRLGAGGGGSHGMGGGGPHAMAGGGPHGMGGGGGPHAMRGNGPHGMGNGPHMRGGNFAEGGGGREFRRGHGDFADHNGRNRGRFAERDRNFDHHHGHGHRVFRNGAWVWVYGPDYYAGDDCYWLLRRARVTGSPYWWSQYNACVGYY